MKREADKLSRILVAVVVGGVLAGELRGQLRGQLGILTPETLAGTNPATGEPWAAGDQYRFVFHTSAGTTAESSDIETYNAWVQGLADGSAAFDIGADDGVTWKVIGSTNTIDARDNTSTNPEEDGSGHPIFLLDGGTLVAADYADLWDGEIANPINFTEQGTIWAFWPYTGSYWNGTKAPGNPTSFSALGGGGQIHQGQASVTTNWVWRVWTGDPPTTELPMYALSEPLEVEGGSTLQLTVTAEGGGYRLDWESQGGMLYNLRRSPDLAGAISTWTLVEGDIEATPPMNTRSVPPTGLEQFYVVEEFPEPPLFEEDFESGDGGFLPNDKGTGTVWSYGDPEAPDLGGGAVTTGDRGSQRCWGTDLTGGYTAGTDACLRSPVIDLTGVSAASVSFSRAIDADVGHTIEVNVIDDTTDALIANLLPAEEDPDRNASTWERIGPVDLPVAALGQAVRLEWRFVGDGSNLYLGAYLDNVVVEEILP